MDKITYLTNPEYFGYYDDPQQKEAAYDPGKKAPCIICGKKWNNKNVRTVALMDQNRTVSYFYRVHQRCDNKMTPEERDAFTLMIAGSAFRS